MSKSKRNFEEVEGKLRNQLGIWDASFIGDITDNVMPWVGVCDGREVIFRNPPFMFAYTIHNMGRYFAARNNLKKMKKGDQLFVYHSGKQRAIIGIAEVVSESFPDPTSSDPAWVAVKVRAQKTLKNPVTLDVIKRTPRLLPMKLVKIGRLSVSPVLAAEWNAILRLSEADQKS
jgi:predicted RNA-binding protein with PUA-like domain